MEISIQLGGKKENIDQQKLRDYAYDIINTEKIFLLIEKFSKL